MAVIEVYADVWCPFAHVGLRSVLDRRHELGRNEPTLRVRAWPLELVNGEPLDAKVTATHVVELQAQVAPDLFARFDTSHFPRTTLPALALAAAAYRCDEPTGEAVSLALRDALFEEGRDVSDPAVLAAIADAHGIATACPADDDAVRADWHEGVTRGVKGSPHFFCGSAQVFCPSLDIAKDGEGHLLLRRNKEMLDAFLSACLRPSV